jgi:hypothetical protein
VASLGSGLASELKEAQVTEEQGERQGEAVPADEDVVSREEAAAAADAGSIGGRRDPSSDEAERPVSEAGGGEAEGFELAEDELRDEAEHGEGHFPPTEAGEAEAADPQPEYAEPDQLGSTAREEEPPDEAGGA